MSLLHETGMFILLIYGQWCFIKNSEYCVNSSMCTAADNSAGGPEIRINTAYMSHSKPNYIMGTTFTRVRIIISSISYAL